MDLCEVRSASGMPHTLDRAAASKAQERLKVSQQRPLHWSMEKGQQRRRWSLVWLFVSCLPLPQSVRVGLCFLVAILISISLCLSAFSLTLVLSLWTFRSCFLLAFPSDFSLCTPCPFSFFLFLWWPPPSVSLFVPRYAGQNGLCGVEVECGKRTVVVVPPCRL